MLMLSYTSLFSLLLFFCCKQVCFTIRRTGAVTGATGVYFHWEDEEEEGGGRRRKDEERGGMGRKEEEKEEKEEAEALRSELWTSVLTGL